MAEHDKSLWLQILCPEENCLREEEKISLPESEKADVKGDWVEVFCPDGSCEVTSPVQLP